MLEWRGCRRCVLIASICGLGSVRDADVTTKHGDFTWSYSTKWLLYIVVLYFLLETITTRTATTQQPETKHQGNLQQLLTWAIENTMIRAWSNNFFEVLGTWFGDSAEFVKNHTFCPLQLVHFMDLLNIRHEVADHSNFDSWLTSCKVIHPDYLRLGFFSQLSVNFNWRLATLKFQYTVNISQQQENLMLPEVFACATWCFSRSESSWRALVKTMRLHRVGATYGRW